MQEKVCTCCKASLPIEKFSKRNLSADGLQNACKDCSNKRNAAHYQTNKLDRRKKISKNKKDAQELARNYVISKLSEGCVDCPEKDIVVLDFDHIGDKKYNISQMINAGYSVETIAKEVDKCEVRCANCHRRKTAKDFNWFKLSVNKEE